jgi:DNA-binding MarR family transcriptional regulator
MVGKPYDVYLEMESAWRSSIPKRLQGMKPKELVKLIRLATAEKGVSQSAATSALGQSQSGMSRITKKLVREKWVVVTRSTVNHKQKLMNATPKAQLAMDTLEGKLAAAIQGAVGSRTAPKTDKRGDVLRRQFGTRTLFTPSVKSEET